jgi:hypothetical protein
MVGVSAIEDIAGRNSSCLFNFSDDGIQVRSRDHENVTGGNCQLAEQRFLQHDCHNAQLALLSSRLAGGDTTRDHHRVIRL